MFRRIRRRIGGNLNEKERTGTTFGETLREELSSVPAVILDLVLNSSRREVAFFSLAFVWPRWEDIVGVEWGAPVPCPDGDEHRAGFELYYTVPDELRRPWQVGCRLALATEENILSRGGVDSPPSAPRST